MSDVDRRRALRERLEETLAADFGWARRPTPPLEATLDMLLDREDEVEGRAAMQAAMGMVPNGIAREVEMLRLREELRIAALWDKAHRMRIAALELQRDVYRARAERAADSVAPAFGDFAPVAPEGLREARFEDVPDAVPPDDLVEAAWTLIANAWGGRWAAAPADWRTAAMEWRDRYAGR